MRTCLLFPNHLGQNYSKKTAHTPYILKPFIHKHIKQHTVKCSENDIFENLRKLYYHSQLMPFPKCYIGGDHSMSIASVADSLANFDNLKVLWIDAHADINSYKESKTKNFHGMPLHYLHSPIHEFNFIRQKLDYKNLLYT